MGKPNRIDEKDSLVLASSICDWLRSKPKYRCEFDEKVRPYAIDVFEADDTFIATLLFDDYDDMLFDNTNVTIDFADPEFFSKLEELLDGSIKKFIGTRDF